MAVLRVIGAGTVGVPSTGAGLVADGDGLALLELLLELCGRIQLLEVGDVDLVGSFGYSVLIALSLARFEAELIWEPVAETVRQALVGGEPVLQDVVDGLVEVAAVADLVNVPGVGLLPPHAGVPHPLVGGL